MVKWVLVVGSDNGHDDGSQHNDGVVQPQQ